LIPSGVGKELLYPRNAIHVPKRKKEIKKKKKYTISIVDNTIKSRSNESSNTCSLGTSSKEVLKCS